MDLLPIVKFKQAITSIPADECDPDISVFNGAVNLTIKRWRKNAGFELVYSTHIMCDSHAEACLIQAVLIAFIHERA